jgi:hypothetical protein
MFPVAVLFSNTCLDGILTRFPHALENTWLPRCCSEVPVAITPQWRTWDLKVKLHIFLISTLNESGQLHVPTASLPKKPHVNHSTVIVSALEKARDVVENI